MISEGVMSFASMIEVCPNCEITGLVSPENSLGRCVKKTPFCRKTFMINPGSFQYHDAAKTSESILSKTWYSIGVFPVSVHAAKRSHSHGQLARLQEIPDLQMSTSLWREERLQVWFSPMLSCELCPAPCTCISCQHGHIGHISIAKEGPEAHRYHEGEVLSLQGNLRGDPETKKGNIPINNR